MLYQETTGQTLPGSTALHRENTARKNLRQAQPWATAPCSEPGLWDWYVDDQPTAEEAFSKLIPRIHNGATVLLHSTSRTNAEILDEHAHPLGRLRATPRLPWRTWA